MNAVTPTSIAPEAIIPSAASPVAGYEALSFVTPNRPAGSGFNYWDVTPSDSYDADCESGAALAQEYLAFIGNWPTYGNATLLTCIVRSMIEQGPAKWSGVNVGFLAGVNRLAMAAAELSVA